MTDTKNEYQQCKVTVRPDSICRTVAFYYRLSALHRLLFTSFTATYAQKSQNSDFAHVCLWFITQKQRDNTSRRQRVNVTIFPAFCRKTQNSNGNNTGGMVQLGYTYLEICFPMEKFHSRKESVKMEDNGKTIGQKVLGNIAKVIVGKERTVKLLLTALVADGHVLLEDVPGTGKTKLAKTLAKTIAGEFARIQFTPDLLPSDITGLNIFDSKKNEFVLRKGPIFTNILLADEINRATPRTQAGLLECMEERQVTIDGESYIPGKPFFVIATQNPVETAGTFPLPEAQTDRFMMKLSMELPGKEEELAILQRYMTEEPLNELQSVLTLDELLQARQQANQTFVHKCVLEYMVSLVDATRQGGNLIMGVSPRGSLALLRCAKAYAYLEGRSYVTPDDVKTLAVPVLAHRVVLGYGSGGSDSAADLIQKLLETIPVPTEDFTA